MDRLLDAYQRLLAESERLVDALSREDWNGAGVCLDRREVAFRELVGEGGPGSAPPDFQQMRSLIERILAVERTLTDLIEARMAGVSTGALGQREALAAYGSRDE